MQIMGFIALATKFNSETRTPVDAITVTRDEYDQLLKDIESMKVEAREQALAGVRRVTMAEKPVVEQLNERFGVIYRDYEKALKAAGLAAGEDERFMNLPSYSLLLSDLYDHIENDLSITLNVLERELTIEFSSVETGHKTSHSTLPLHWFDPDADEGLPVWDAEINSHIDALKQAKARKEAQLARKRKEDEERDRQTYLRLHKRFGHENHS
jgi:hypothetical protein